MNGAELLRGVDFVHREKNISKEVIFASIEKAVRLAIQKCYDDEDGIVVDHRPRSPARSTPRRARTVLTPEELGRIAAQAAKQVHHPEASARPSATPSSTNYAAKKGDLVSGTVQRFEGGAATVTLGKTEALLPRGEQIPGETHHVGERVKAVILDVARSATASRSSCRGRTPTLSAGCSRTKSPRSTTAPSRSRPWPARPAIAPRSPSPAST